MTESSCAKCKLTRSALEKIRELADMMLKEEQYDRDEEKYGVRKMNGQGLLP